MSVVPAVFALVSQHGLLLVIVIEVPAVFVLASLLAPWLVVAFNEVPTLFLSKRIVDAFPCITALAPNVLPDPQTPPPMS